MDVTKRDGKRPALSLFTDVYEGTASHLWQEFGKLGFCRRAGGK